MANQSCAICESEHASWVAEMLLQGVRQRDIVEGLRERGLAVAQSSLSRHKRQHLGLGQESSSIADEDLDASIAELRAEASRAPVTIRASYYMLIKWLQQMHGKPVTNEAAIKAAESIARINGLSRGQRALLEYMDARFGGRDE